MGRDVRPRIKIRGSGTLVQRATLLLLRTACFFQDIVIVAKHCYSLLMHRQRQAVQAYHFVICRTRVPEPRISMRGLIFLLLLIPLSLHPYSGQIGSDSNVTSSQAFVVFEGGDASNNRMARYALMANGFLLQDESTTCSYDSVFPISSYIGLNGGTLYQANDMIFSQPSFFGSGGTILGNDNIISFPVSVDSFDFPLASDVLSFVAQRNYPQNYSVKWSYDDTYICIAMTYRGIYAYLCFYEFNGSSVLYRRLQYLSSSAKGYSADWRPGTYQTAVGYSSGSTGYLRAYTFTPPSTVTLNDTETLGGPVTAVRWHPSGDYVAIGVDDHTVQIFSFNGTSLSFTFSVSQPPHTETNSMSWDSTGSYLVTGAEYASFDNLYIYYFDESAETLYPRDSVEIGTANVTTVDWMPSSSYIAVGLDSSDHRLRVYYYDEDADSLSERAVTSEIVNKTVYGVSWHPNKSHVSVGFDSTADETLKTYYFDSEQNVLRLLSLSNSIAPTIRAVDWSHNGNYIVTGGEGVTYLDSPTAVFENKPTGPLIVQDIIMNFNSDSTLIGTVICRGNCALNGIGGSLNLGDGAIVVDDGASLSLSNIRLCQMKENNIRCVSENSQITFNNCDLSISSDYTFTIGSISFEQDVSISGTNIFNYESLQTSTITSSSRLTINHGTRFHYDPQGINGDLLHMANETSQLYLDGCTLASTETPIRLTRGTVLLDNLVTLSNVSFGDSTLQNDVYFQILSAAEVKAQGIVHYNNTQ